MSVLGASWGQGNLLGIVLCRSESDGRLCRSQTGNGGLHMAAFCNSPGTVSLRCTVPVHLRTYSMYRTVDVIAAEGPQFLTP